MPGALSRAVCLALVAATLIFASSATALGGAVEIRNPRTGETFTYRPSFAPAPVEERPQRRFLDASTKRTVTYEASRQEVAERHRMKHARTHVRFVSSEPKGTVIVDTPSLFYLTGRDGRAVRYGIGVGREGFTWSGVERVRRKAEWPDWTPPAGMRERRQGFSSGCRAGRRTPWSSARPISARPSAASTERRRARRSATRSRTAASGC